MSLSQYFKSRYKQASKRYAFLPEPPSQALVAVSEEAPGHAVKRLRRALRWHSDPYSKVVLDRIIPGLEKPVCRDEQLALNAELSRDFETIDPTQYSHRLIYRAASVCVASGFYVLGSKLRDDAMTSLCHTEPATREDWYAVFAAALEREHLDVFSRLSRSQNQFRIDLPPGTDSLLAAMGVDLFNERVRAPDFASSLGDYCGRRVALVGPVNYPDDIGDEINAYDYVARLGYSGPSSLAEGTGLRTDLSFYANHKLRDVHALTQNMAGLQAIFLKWGVSVSGLTDSGVDPEKVHMTPLVRHIVYNTTLNSGLNFAFVLAAMLRVKLTVYGFNFFLDPRYPQGYAVIGRRGQTAENPYSSQERAVSFARHHHPTAQFRFFKKLVRAGLCEADRDTHAIADMTDEQYLESLEATVGRATFDMQSGAAEGARRA